MRMHSYGGQVITVRRTFYLLRSGEGHGHQALVRVCVRHDWFMLTEEEAGSAADAYAEPVSEEEKTERLNEAVASYVADTSTHPILESHFWVPDARFPIEQAGQVVADLNQGLNDLLTQGGVTVADWTGVPSPLDGVVAGISANFVLAEPEELLRNTREIFWVIGLMVALATGNIALAVGCGKGLAKDVIKRAVTKAIGNLLDLSPRIITDSQDPGQGRMSLSPEDPEELSGATVLTSPGREADKVRRTPREILVAAAKDEPLTKGHRAIDSPAGGMTAI